MIAVPGGRRILAAAVALASPCALASSWTLEPHATLGSQVADNPRLVPSGADAYETGVLGATGELGVDLGRQTERSEWHLAPTASFQRYHDQQELDADDQRLAARLVLGGERVDWKADLDGVRDSTLTSERGVTGPTQGNNRHERLSLGLGPEVQFTPRLSTSTRVGVQYDRYAHSEQTGLTDYRYSSVSQAMGYRLTELTTGSLRANWNRLSRDQDDDDVTDEALSLVLQSRMTERWDVTLSAGPSRTESDQGTDDGVVFDADSRYTGLRTDLWAQVGRSNIPNGRGTLARSDRVTAGLDHRVTERLSAGASLQWNRNRDLTRLPGVDRDDRVRYATGEGHVSWAIHPEWKLSLGVRAQRQETGYQDQSTIDAHGWSGNIVVTWTGQSWLPR